MGWESILGATQNITAPSTGGVDWAKILGQLPSGSSSYSNLGSLLGGSGGSSPTITDAAGGGGTLGNIWKIANSPVGMAAIGGIGSGIAANSQNNFNAEQSALTRAQQQKQFEDELKLKQQQQLMDQSKLGVKADLASKYRDFKLPGLEGFSSGGASVGPNGIDPAVIAQMMAAAGSGATPSTPTTPAASGDAIAQAAPSGIATNPNSWYDSRLAAQKQKNQALLASLQVDPTKTMATKNYLAPTTALANTFLNSFRQGV